MLAESASISPSESNCLLYDRSASFGVLELTGTDRAAFLHGQCTNSIVGQPAGAAVEACVLTAQGRVVDLVTVCVGLDSLRVVASAPRVHTLASLFEKHIFPMDRVSLEVKDLAVFSLLGPDPLKMAESTIIKELGSETLEAAGITVVPSSGLDGAAKPSRGATLLIPTPLATAVWSALSSSPSVSFAMAESDAWTAARVSAGRPEADAEYEAVLQLPSSQPSSLSTVSDDVGAEPAMAEKPKIKKSGGCLPLELGLFHTVDFNKGCYMGQETVAKVAKQDAVRRELWGLVWEHAEEQNEDNVNYDIAAGSRVYLLSGTDSNDSEGAVVGTVTSVAPPAVNTAAAPSSGAVALALLKRSSVQEGQRVCVLPVPSEPLDAENNISPPAGEVSAPASVGRGCVARLVDLPYSSRSLFQAASPPVQPSVNPSPTSAPMNTEANSGVQEPAPPEGPSSVTDAAVDDAERKRAKIAAMEAKLAAFKQKKSGDVTSENTDPSPATGATPTAADDKSEENSKAAEAERKAAKLAANKAKLDAMNARKKKQKSEGN